MRWITKGSASHSEFFVLVDSTTGLPKTGIADTAVTASYARQRSARVAITVSALGATTTAFTSGGWIEEDSTNQPGLYRLDVPDAAFVTGVDQVIVTVKATGAKTEHKEFRLVDVNNQDGVRFGLTALPNAAAGATGGLDCMVTLGGTASAGAATSITLTGGVATDNYYNHQVVQITGGTGAGQARIIIGYVGSTKVATVSRAWTTNPDNTSVYQVKGLETTPTWQLTAGTLSAAGATSATLAGASSTTDIYNGALLVITAGTGQRQARIITAYNGGTLVATVDRAWATTPDSTSVYVVYGTDLPALNASLKVQGVVLADTVTTYTGNTPQTGDAFTRLGVPVGASISADVAGVQSDTDNIQTRLPAALVSGRIDASVGAYPGNTAQTGDNFARLGTPVGASISADIAGVQADTDNLQTRVPAALVGGKIDANVGTYTAGQAPLQPTVAGRTLDVATTGEAGLDFDNIKDATVSHTLANITVPAVTAAGSVSGNVGGNVTGSVGSLAAQAKTDVNNEILDVLDTDVNTEITSIPSATTTLRGMIKTLFAFCTNKLTETGTTQTLRNRADSATIGTAPASDDNVTAVRGSFS